MARKSVRERVRESEGTGPGVSGWKDEEKRRVRNKVKGQKYNFTSSLIWPAGVPSHLEDYG